MTPLTIHDYLHGLKIYFGIVLFALGIMIFWDSNPAILAKIGHVTPWGLLVPIALDILSMFYLLTGTSGISIVSLIFLILTFSVCPNPLFFQMNSLFLSRFVDASILLGFHMTANFGVPMLVVMFRGRDRTGI